MTFFPLKQKTERITEREGREGEKKREREREGERERERERGEKKLERTKSSNLWKNKRA